MKKIFTLLALTAAMFVGGVQQAKSDCYLVGSFFEGEWKDQKGANLDNGPISLYLEPGTYTLKFTDGTTWWGNNGTIEATETNWTFSSEWGNCTLKVTDAGYYVFRLWWNGGTPTLGINFPNTTVYFANTLGWTKVYLHHGYWNGDDGVSNTGTGNIRGIEMTSIGDNIYAAKVPSELLTYRVCFTEDLQVNADCSGYNNFYATKVVWQDVAFNTGAPLYIPTTQASDPLNECTYYYYGAWQQYPTYTRTDLTADNFGTLCLPFAATLEGATAYSVAGTVDNGIALNEVGTNIAAGTPYIIKATATTLTATCSGTPVAAPVDATGLVGTYGGTTLGNFDWSDQSKLYVLYDNELHQFQGVGTANIGANKAYIYLEGVEAAPAGSIVLPFDEESTGIEGVSANVKAGEVYNLQGQRVNNAQKGLFIVDGKKVIRK